MATGFDPSKIAGGAFFGGVQTGSAAPAQPTAKPQAAAPAETPSEAPAAAETPASAEATSPAEAAGAADPAESAPEKSPEKAKASASKADSAPAGAPSKPATPAPDAASDVAPGSAPAKATAQSTAVVPARSTASGGNGTALQVAATRASGLPMTLDLEGGQTLDITAWVENDPGMGDLELLQAPMPIVSPGYAQSKIVEEFQLQEGLWTHQSTGEQVAELSLVVIDSKARRDFRIKFDQGSSEQVQPICTAPDGRFGTGSEKFDDEEAPKRPFVTLADDKTMHQGAFHVEPGRPCDSCSFAEWREVEGKRKPPLCRETYNLIGHEETLGPIVVPMRGTGIKPMNRWRAGWWPKVGRFAAQFHARTGRKLPASLFGVFTVTLKKVKTAYVPVFGPIGLTPQERLIEILAMRPIYDSILEQVGSHDAQAAIDEATSFDAQALDAEE